MTAARMFRRAMDALYNACIAIGCLALVLIAAIIPWAVFTRYALNSAASWPEAAAILLTILLTFIGAAAGYRFHVHMNLTFFVRKLPPALYKAADLVAELLMAAIALFMTIWGISLVEVTWYNSVADFPFLSVGVTYLPIPIGGICLLLFVAERLLIGTPPDPVAHRDPAAAVE